MAKEELAAAVNELGLDIRAEFVPWSKSRNAKPAPVMSDRSLNWRVTLIRPRSTYNPDREALIMAHEAILTTDYSAGIASCPSYKQLARPTLEYAEKIAVETETGRGWRAHGGRGAPIEPDKLDVINSLVMDASVLNSSSFEDWADEFGYDRDSRKAETIYRACLDIALKLRNAIGEAGLEKLQQASQDY